MHVCNIGTGEATQKKYKRFKFGSGQVYDHSNDWAAVLHRL